MTITPDQLTGAFVKQFRTQNKITREDFKTMCVEAGLDWGKSVARLCNIEAKDSWKNNDREIVAQVINQLAQGLAVSVPPTPTSPTDEQLDAVEVGPPGVRDAGDPFAASQRFIDGVKNMHAEPVPVWCDEEPEDDEMNESSVNIEPLARPEVTVPPGALREDETVALRATASIDAPPTLQLLETDVVDEPTFALDPEDMVGFETDYAAREVDITNSQVQTFKRCRRRWWLTWYRGLAPRHQNLLDVRSTGLRLHRALQAWYVPDGQTPTDPRDALERALTEDWTALVTAAQERGHDEFVLAELTDKFQKAAELERAMIEGYVQWLQETGADSDLKVVAAETQLRVPLFEHVRADGETQHVHAMGLLDVRAQRNSDGARLFIDHKTVGNFKQPVAMLPQNEQMLHYHLLEWLASRDGEERCDGALYNMLRRVKRTAAAKPPFYDRYEVRHNIHELENYRRRLISVSREILRMTELLDAGADPLDVAYPTPTKDCSWDCDFFAVCTMFDDGSRAEDALAGLFQTVDPNARYEDKKGNE